MSERGSFVTEYIGCAHCLAVARDLLLAREKYLCSAQVPGWSTDKPLLPIIAGKVGGSYQGEELHTFSQQIVQALAARLCHPLRIAVLAEHGQEIFYITPAGST